MTASFGVVDGTHRRPEMRLLSRRSILLPILNSCFLIVIAVRARFLRVRPRQPQSIEYTNNRLR
ncbi:hypothetical protein ALC60_00476 [Trachymyrmex zeteki]|uniref:Uncharacterized protein n=1 Tax=Mycetomoellerius zeteki TaxID=64791 RepID=A0A151XJ96_9HYME|nr:hypothetical protein ALC60_00476 [Trachymyrmex zeteki]